MDTAVVVIPKLSSRGLAEFLSERLPDQAEPWIVPLNGRAAVYLNIVPAEEADLGPGDFQQLSARLGGNEFIALLADVSVRNIGCAELRELITAILDRFPGLASDDVADHWWTAEEIRKPEEFGLQPFWPHEVRSSIQGYCGDA